MMGERWRAGGGLGLSALLGVLLLAAAPGCGGGSSAEVTTNKEAAAIVVPDERLDATWVVQLATEDSLGVFAQEPGWVSLVMKRDYVSAVRQLGSKGGLPAARAHAESAALYRQAALAAAHSLIEVYGKTPEPTDPVGAAHLLTVSNALTGDLDAARKAAATLAASGDDATLAWHAPWKAWLDSGAAWPPDLSGLPIELPPARPGEWPELTQLPHYALPERGGSGARRDMADPSALLALALWHDQAATAAAGGQDALVKSYRAGYRMPVEPPAEAAGDAPMELLFGSDFLVADDVAFLADLHGPAGAGAIEAHQDRSLLAWLAVQSRKDGKIDAEKAIDVLADLREALVARAATRTGGNVQGHQRIFADIAHVGALRSLALVAEKEGDREASGLLRINALDHSDKATACPVGLLALAAWDASNRYPLRALDILHAQTRRYPSLEIARYGLDVLGLRVNSERVGETPGM